MPYRFADCELDERTRSLMRSGEVVAIEPKVFDFLLYLIDHRDRLVTKSELLAALWQDVIVHESALARLAMEARKAVGDGGRVQHTIETRRGHGYRFAAPVTVLSVSVPPRARRSGEGPAPNVQPGDVRRPPMLRLGGADTTAVESTRSEHDPGELVVRWIYPRRGAVRWNDSESVSLGRGAGCDVVLDGAEVSRCHAELVRVGPICGIRDLGSSNGTYVNGQRVSERALAERDVVRCGEWVGLVVTADILPVDVRTGAQLLAEGLWGGLELASALASVERSARSVSPLVIQGQPGTGKATAARAVHRWSGRPGELVVIAGRNSPDGVETWGPRSNGFDNASFMLERAHQGTLLLENLPDIEPELQRSLGSALTANAAAVAANRGPDVRLVATTDGSFSDGARGGRIDAPLAGCLQGVVVELPALADRVADIPELFLRLLSQYSGGQPPEVTARVVERLCLHRWPGNVEELELLARQIAATHADKRVVGRGDLPAELLGVDGGKARA